MPVKSTFFYALDSVINTIFTNQSVILKGNTETNSKTGYSKIGDNKTKY